jgi:hypothetical protein
MLIKGVSNRIFHVGELSRTENRFCSPRRSEFMSAVGEAGGAVVASIHPLYIRRMVDSGISFKDPHFSKFFLRDVYDGFLRNVTEFIQGVDEPLLIFAQSRSIGQTVRWLDGLNLKTLAVIVKTQNDDPKPLVESIGQYGPSWMWLIGLLKDMGVRSASLIGETAYTYNRTVPGGCVYEAESRFKFHLDTEVLREFTYPNINIDDPSIYGPIG